MTTRFLVATALAAGLGAGLGATAPALAQDLTPTLNLDTAKAIADGCEAFARENSLRVTIIVMDNSGNLKVLRRMDGTPFMTLEIAEMKARTGAGLRRPSAALGEIAERIPGIALVPGMASWEGGVPIFTVDGAHLGGVGTSGASSAQDAACGRAGIAAAGVLDARP